MLLGNKYCYFDNLQFKNSKLNMDTKLHKIDFVVFYIAAKFFFSLSRASRLVFLVPYILFLSGKTITSSVTVQDTG